MTNTNRHFLVASLTALIGLAAFAGDSAQSYREPSAQASLNDQNINSETYTEERSSTDWNGQPGYYSDHYYRSSTASNNSGTRDRVQDPTNPRGAYDTDRSGWANRWNAVDRETVAFRNYQRTPTYGETSFTTTQSSANSSDTSLEPSVSNRDQKEGYSSSEPAVTANQRADVEITRQIRRELSKDKSLSVYGKNVKIETQDGTATLSGPVKTETEKDKVESAAEKIVGTNKVRNELEIKQ